ncbi:MAG: hypothetical protein ACRDL7_00220 [Gaiellaceae bacterium]
MDGKAGETAKLFESAVRYELYEATKRFSEKSKISGVSFVLAGVRMWWEELNEINTVSTADYFRALADLAEARGHEAKMNAEDRRRDAVERLIRGAGQIIAAENTD